MRFEDYDLIHSVHDRIEEFHVRHKRLPTVLVLSPTAYQWLRALQESDADTLHTDLPRIGEWIFIIDDVPLRLEIDEVADNFSIVLR